MNDESKKKYYQIVVDTWKMFTQSMTVMNSSDQYMEMVIGKFLEYEQLWKYTPYWSFAGRECSAKLQEIERIWKELKGGQHENS